MRHRTNQELFHIDAEVRLHAVASRYGRITLATRFTSAQRHRSSTGDIG
jgi:hypothetical protein